MNLIVDVGNTFVKLAIFQNEKLLYKESISLDNFIENLKSLAIKYPKIDNTIVSSVGKLNEDQANFLEKNYNPLELNYKTKLPFKNSYESPKTLGVDRMALVSASANQFPNKNVLIIDSGTCITYDFITTENEYLGGAISPGIKMRYQALNNFTANLPLLEIHSPEDLVGRSTKDSIHSGIIFGVLGEIEGVISKYEEKYSDLTVILTGGDSNFLSKQLKSSIFANSNFLLEGLNYILQFNSD